MKREERRERWREREERKIVVGGSVS